MAILVIRVDLFNNFSIIPEYFDNGVIFINYIVE